MFATANYLIIFNGVVQGVGFRPLVYKLAQEKGLLGWVRNAGSSVEICLQDVNRQIVDEFIHQIVDNAPLVSVIENYTITEVKSGEVELVKLSDFTIISSTAQISEQGHNISSDLATCSDCERELLDPSNRRFQYPFINCTNCGPRFTIVKSLPYDRANTTMTDFTMCPACQAEYDDPTNRRFHAQPNACPICGPALTVWQTPTDKLNTLLRADKANTSLRGALRRSNPSSESVAQIIVVVTQAILAGQIIAVKGIGGFNLVCDANNDNAIQRLRDFKHRQAKPFAICCSTIDEIKQLCDCDELEQSILTGVERPIVLLHKKVEGIDKISPKVAGNLAEIGCMLPNNPVAILLMQAVRRPLVWTSGNILGEPIVADNDLAHQRLSSVATLYLDHNRDIINAYDDSVVRVVNGSIQFIRQGRGYAPVKLTMPKLKSNSKPILALGAQQKSTFSLFSSSAVMASQHLGDLDDLEAVSNYQYTIDLYRHLFDFPQQNYQIAHDLHPQYASTQLAETMANKTAVNELLTDDNITQGITLKPVQHHMAHAWAVLGENWHSIDFDNDNILCLAWDGTGYGTDGKVWGGEVLMLSQQNLTRISHLQNTPLLGGQNAVMSPATMAYSWLHTLGLLDKMPTELNTHFGSDKTAILQSMTQTDKSDSLQTSSMGRLFDAVSALLGICFKNDYEGQGACELEAAAWNWLDSQTGVNQDKYVCDLLSAENADYDFVITDGVFSPQKLIEYILTALNKGIDRGELALHFHIACLRLIRQLALTYKANKIATSGGVFCNRMLAQYSEGLQNINVLSHHKLPPNDASISFGQVVATLVSK